MKINKRLVFVFFFMLIIFSGYSQDDDGHLSSKKGETSFGIGMGLPYGGFGMRLGTNLADEFNLFGGIGYQISGVGFNIGLRKEFASSSMTQFYLLGMFGTNSVIKVVGLSEYDKVYTGATFGMGIKINSTRKEGNYWDIGLLVPVRSSNFHDDETRMQNDSRIASYTAPWPVLFCVGYNFNL